MHDELCVRVGDGARHAQEQSQAFAQTQLQRSAQYASSGWPSTYSIAR